MYVSFAVDQISDVGSNIFTKLIWIFNFAVWIKLDIIIVFNLSLADRAGQISSIGPDKLSAINFQN